MAPHATAITAPATKIQVNAAALGNVAVAVTGPAAVWTTKLRVVVRVARTELTSTGPTLAPRSWNISVIPVWMPVSPLRADRTITFVTDTRIATRPANVGIASTTIATYVPWFTRRRRNPTVARTEPSTTMGRGPNRLTPFPTRGAAISIANVVG